MAAPMKSDTQELQIAQDEESNTPSDTRNVVKRTNPVGDSSSADSTPSDTRNAVDEDNPTDEDDSSSGIEVETSSQRTGELHSQRDTTKLREELSTHMEEFLNKAHQMITNINTMAWRTRRPRTRLFSEDSIDTENRESRSRCAKCLEDTEAAARLRTVQDQEYLARAALRAKRQALNNQMPQPIYINRETSPARARPQNSTEPPRSVELCSHLQSFFSIIQSALCCRNHRQHQDPLVTPRPRRSAHTA